jgi:hypothetical protein
MNVLRFGRGVDLLNGWAMRGVEEWRIDDILKVAHEAPFFLYFQVVRSR